MRRLLATLFCAAMLFGATSAQAASPADAYPSGPMSAGVRASNSPSRIPHQ